MDEKLFSLISIYKDELLCFFNIDQKLIFNGQIATKGGKCQFA